jgi:hypothetical protein
MFHGRGREIQRHTVAGRVLKPYGLLRKMRVKLAEREPEWILYASNSG